MYESSLSNKKWWTVTYEQWWTGHCGHEQRHQVDFYAFMSLIAMVMFTSCSKDQQFSARIQCRMQGSDPHGFDHKLCLLWHPIWYFVHHWCLENLEMNMFLRMSLTTSLLDRAVRRHNLSLELFFKNWNLKEVGSVPIHFQFGNFQTWNYQRKWTKYKKIRSMSAEIPHFWSQCSIFWLARSSLAKYGNTSTQKWWISVQTWN